jgi:dynein heavy chain
MGPSDIEEVVDRIAELLDKLEEAKERIAHINLRETFFGVDATDYQGNLEMVEEDLKPHALLWQAAGKFRASMPQWLDGPFMNISAAEVEDDITEGIKELNKMAKGSFADFENPMKLLMNIKDDMTAFKKNVPIIVALRNPGMRGRHWKDLASQLEDPALANTESLTLGFLLGLGVAEDQTKMGFCADMSERATKEYKLEVQLKEMMDLWVPIEFETKDYKGQQILTATDDIQALLDDHIVKTQTMTSSPYIKPLKATADEWETRLMYIQELLDQWLLVQRDWMSLSPVFASEDIMRQMPTEGRRFQQVDKEFKKMMDKVVATPLVLVMATEATSPKKDQLLLNSFGKCGEFLEMIKKGLSDYLELKRAVFARFYFLDDEGLLMILAQARDPTAVQPHLNKIFDNISKLTFTRAEGAPGTERDCAISEMWSGEGEMVPMSREVLPFGPKNSGNVEMWLLDTEQTMKVSLHKQMVDAMEDYATAERKKFVINWPGQVVLGITGVYWTRMVEEGLNSKGVQGLKDCIGVLNSDLQDVVVLVRGKLTKMQIFTLGAMTTLDVHARDVVDMMISEEIDSVDTFAWTSQLRYYWFDTGPDRFTSPNVDYSPCNLVLKMIIAEYPYGWEYLGNSFRLVVTGLTDRCYRTLMMSLHLNLGGAPAGPAGTGKTETTKDLSKAVAKQCVVFNCSDALTFFAMAKFFKGLSSSGAWACFDEFNRIDVEVLSVVAQQVKQIQDSVQARMPRFFFEGTDLLLALDPACWNAITMNPGYAGRSDLPDNLVVLYRPVAMMVPNYAMISEISLYSFGFDNARPLSIKATQALQLSSQQLAAERHYDFGMRAVKSILNAAGALKRAQPNENEDVVVKKAIMDVNLPKFTSADTPLFVGILSDLFPGLVMPEQDYDNLTEMITEQAKKMNIQLVPSFMEKTILLYEMFMCRHGLCVCGAANSGKSMALKVLAGAMTRMNKKWGLPEDAAELDPPMVSAEKVEIFSLNPKSVKMGQLYGDFDPVSLEWTDGILAIIFRRCAEDHSPNRKWVIFDGPVDAIWIENMNTVLDDNKKLCLNSGEIIKMSAVTSMVFEVGDLQEASPATVSRIGVIFMEPQSLGWQCSIDSWLERLPAQYKKHEDWLNGVIKWLLPKALDAWKYHLTEATVTQDIWLIHNCLKIFDAMAPGFRALNDEGDPVGEDYVTPEPKVLEGIMAFAMIWSIGATTNSEGRAKFDELMRDWCRGGNDFPIPGSKKGETGRKLLNAFNENGSVYDAVFDIEGGRWVPWQNIMEPFTIADNASFQEMVVPTLDSTRYGFILNTMFMDHKGVLYAGDTGTGKTVVIKQTMLALDTALFDSVEVNFSANTTAGMTQNTIDAKMEKRRKGVYGPLPGKWSVVFVDDLNMPAKETYGAQPPIEILRQFMDHAGWYDLEDMSQFRKMQDVQFVAAQGPPTGGRSAVTPRYLHHFNLIEIAPFEDVTLSQIFTTIMDWFVQKIPMGARGASAPIVSATIEVFRTVSDRLLPTPAKSHYTFNLRDLSKVIQGVLGVAPDVVDGVEKMIALWVHEEQRVFKDRLTDEPDRKYFDSLLADMVKAHFKADFDNVTTGPDAEILIFADFMGEGGKYDIVPNTGELIAKVEKSLADYNAQTSKPMNLVMFLYAVEHVCRISRCLRNPGGHALLVGIGGSGRQSCTRLAAHVGGEMKVMQPELSKAYGMNEWHEDIKIALSMAGGAKGDPMVFLFTDQQIFDETQVEEINGLLNTCEIPNLWKMDEYNGILEEMSKFTKADSRAAKYLHFVNRCKANMHMCLCMSPIGDAFRTRLRNFPALVNCTTINWFTAWPGNALQAVAGAALVKTIDDSLRQKVVDTCQAIHQSVEVMSEEFLKDVGRVIYITPTSFLELVKSVLAILADQTEKVERLLRRYGDGLQKMAETEGVVSSLQAALAEQTPIMEQKAKETAELMAVVQKEQAEADIVQANVEKEAAGAKIESDKAAVIEASVSADLAEAMPALESANKAVDKLDKKSVDNIKGLGKPPPAIRLVMQAVVIMLGIKPKKIKDPGNERKKIDDWWGAAQTMMKDADFLSNLKNFNALYIETGKFTDEVIEEMRMCTEVDQDPARAGWGESADVGTAKLEGILFTPDVIGKKGSGDAAGLCSFILAIIKFYVVVKTIEPKKAQLAEAQAIVKDLTALLAVKQAELDAVVAKVAKLQETLAAAIAEKKELDDGVAISKQRLVNADKLISALGGNKIQWIETVENLKEGRINMLGDVLLAAGSMSYLGPFQVQYRRQAQNMWIKNLGDLGIPCTQTFTVEGMIGEPVLIREWSMYGLPNDSLSVENGIIVAQSSRWPLLIDPQTQGNKWIKNMEMENQLKVVKLTQGDYMRNMEAAIQFGLPVLIENVESALDPSLDPVLTKSYYQKGNTLLIKLGENEIEFSLEFKLYITTKLRSPHYSPETSTKVSIVDFTITQLGLEDQLVGITAAAEQPEKLAMKEQLTVEGAENNKKLKEIEDAVLKDLSEAEGMILDNTELINTLSEAKATGDEISAKMEAAAKIEAEIEIVRKLYIPISNILSVLYFCIADLANITVMAGFGLSAMYQFSLAWFVDLYLQTIEQAAQGNTEIVDAESGETREATFEEQIKSRMENLNDHFLYSLYCSTCRCIFERDKMLFSLYMCMRLKENYKASREKLLGFYPAEKLDDSMDMAEWRFYLTAQGGAVLDGSRENPAPDWLSSKAWTDFQQLSNLSAFAGLADDIAENSQSWTVMYESNEPHLEILPGKWGEDGTLTGFQKLLVLRCVRLDFVVPGTQKYVVAEMGQKFVEPPAFSAEISFAGSAPYVPLVFILSKGQDVSSIVDAFAKKMGFDPLQGRLSSISLGQGQDTKAVQLIKVAKDEGTWVFLHNCHLMSSWMGALEAIVDRLKGDVDGGRCHADFRLWLTVMPSPAFPAAILQNGVKMTNEPPSGIRMQMINKYRGYAEGTTEQGGLPFDIADDYCTKPGPWRKLLFGVTFNHALMQERLKFGPLGWNINYGWNEADLEISIRNCQIFLDVYDEIPYEALNYLIGHCNYGGRVTDDWDRRCMVDTIAGFVNEGCVTDDNFAFSPDGLYKAPPDTNLEGYIEYLVGLPLFESPQVFGLHENANITYAIQQSNRLVDTLGIVQSGGGGGGGGGDDGAVDKLAETMLEKLPENFDMEKVEGKYPIIYEESLNTVLKNDTMAFNVLLNLVRSSLKTLRRAIQGFVSMSAALDDVYNGLYAGKVPDGWMAKAYPSLCPLASWFQNLLDRCTFLQDWYNDGSPNCFWLPGFFFTMGFLTGVRQNFARSECIPIDQLYLTQEVVNFEKETCPKAPYGTYIWGLFLEGARWDSEAEYIRHRSKLEMEAEGGSEDVVMKGCLRDSEPKVLFTNFPLLWLKPRAKIEAGDHTHALQNPEDKVLHGYYKCPLYKTAERKGVLATTGQSSNFVMPVFVPSDMPGEFWTKRAVALLTSLSD